MFAAAKVSEVLLRERESERPHPFLGWLGVNGFKSEQTGSRREHKSLTLRPKFVLKEKRAAESAPSSQRLADLKIAKVTAMLNPRF